MGSKVSGGTLGNPLNSSFTVELNQSLDRLADEFDKVVYRDGSQDITGTVNANSNRIINLPPPMHVSEPVRVQDLMDLLPDPNAAQDVLLRFHLSQPNGGTLVGFKAAGTGSVNRSVEDKLREKVSVKDFGAVGDGISNDTAAIQAALNTGKNVYAPAGTYLVNAPLNITIDGTGFYGDGYSTKILTSDPTGDIFVIGNGTNEISGLKFHDFRVWSTVTKTAGAIFNCRFISDSRFSDIHAGSLDDYVASGNANRLFDGYIFDRFSEITVHDGQCVASNKLIQCRGNLDQSFGAELSIGGNWRGVHAVVGIHQGGGAGGVYYGRCDISNCATGVLIDQALTNTFNREAFFAADFTVDTCGVGVHINQTTASDAQFLFNRTWIAGCSSHGLRVQAANAARVVALIHTYKNGGDGIRLEDASAYLVVPSASRFDLNTGWGINPTVLSTRMTIQNPSFLANGLGTFNPASNSKLETRQLGSVNTVVSPTVGWGNDFSENTMTVANGANEALASGSGLIVVSNPTNGHTAAYIVGGGTVMLLATTGSSWVAPTTSPGAGQASIQWNGSTTYRLYNNTGGSEDFIIALAARSRNSN